MLFSSYILIVGLISILRHIGSPLPHQNARTLCRATTTYSEADAPRGRGLLRFCWVIGTTPDATRIPQIETATTLYTLSSTMFLLLAPPTLRRDNNLPL
jgi:hypothetical protein